MRYLRGVFFSLVSLSISAGVNNAGPVSWPSEVGRFKSIQMGKLDYHAIEGVGSYYKLYR